MLHEHNVKLYIEHTEKIAEPDIQLLNMKQIKGATYVLYMCHNNKTKYVAMIQDTNICSYKPDDELLRDLFPEFC